VYNSIFNKFNEIAIINFWFLIYNFIEIILMMFPMDLDPILITPTKFLTNFTQNFHENNTFIHWKRYILKISIYLHIDSKVIGR